MIPFTTIGVACEKGPRPLAGGPLRSGLKGSDQASFRVETLRVLICVRGE